jgi:hypothetical protein
VHAHVQMLVLVVKVATVLEEYTAGRQCSLVRIWRQKYSMQRTFINKCFLSTVETVCCVTLQTFFHDEKVETEVRKWPRRQPQGFCAAGVEALVERWDKCISVGG